jgi:hypothetical protein
MMKMMPFLQDDAFGPDALRAMSTALEEVCRMLKVDRDQDAREVMAVRIIELARRGECDPQRLRSRVLREAGATLSAVGAAPVTDARQPRPNGLQQAFKTSRYFGGYHA